MNQPNFKRTKLACYTAYFTMQSVFSLPPVLFASLQDLYGISYTLLGTLVLTNFCTQMTVDLIFTFFTKYFNVKNWMYLTLFWAALPVAASIMFMLSPMPDMDVSGSEEGTKGTKRRTLSLAICVAAIFFGSCAENSMSNWVSTFMENALHVDKTLGDILGMAMFAILLGIARISYAKFGKNIMRVLLFGMIGAATCYLVAGLSTNVVFAFVACILTGLFTSMLWPGTLIMMEENIPGVGVAAYALCKRNTVALCYVSSKIFKEVYLS